MSNRSGTTYSAPTDADRRPVLLGVSTVDGITPVPLEVNPSTGQLQTSGSGGGGGGTVSSVTTAQVTVNTTAVQFTASSTSTTNGVLFGALSTNSASVFVGNSSVTTSNGIELQPGQVLSHSVNDVSKLYFISAASTSDEIWWTVV